MSWLDLVDIFLYTTDRHYSVVVEPFGNSDNIIISNIPFLVIIRIFSTATLCENVKTLISEIYTSYGIG